MKARYACSGEAAAHEAGSGDAGECWVCEGEAPMGEMHMHTVFDMPIVLCAACDARWRELREARLKEFLQVFNPNDPSKT